MRTQIPQENTWWTALRLVEAPTIWVAEDLPRLAWAKLGPIKASPISALSLLLEALDTPLHRGCLCPKVQVSKHGI